MLVFFLHRADRLVDQPRVDARIAALEALAAMSAVQQLQRHARRREGRHGPYMTERGRAPRRSRRWASVGGGGFESACQKAICAPGETQDAAIGLLHVLLGERDDAGADIVAGVEPPDRRGAPDERVPRGVEADEQLGSPRGIRCADLPAVFLQPPGS